jgi:4-amino-4-deoxy-L-arabinose transferase-like glycosyltransferase
MANVRHIRLSLLILATVVVAVAGGTRAWYLATCADQGAGPTPREVQGPTPRPDYEAGTKLRDRQPPSDLDALVHNLTEDRWFGSQAPLAEQKEKTAHRAPGYPWLFALASRLDQPDRIMRWLQCALGTLTALCYFFFALRAFRSPLVAVLAGLLCALHPFWIINTAELEDGVLATFLLAASLTLGTRASQTGGALSSLFFGLALAGLSMVRAALLPFAVVGLLWFLLRCRKLQGGWFVALLAFLGFANGLAPWMVRNFREFGEPVPVADSALLHLWMGNNRLATGGPLAEKTMRQALAADPERLQEILQDTNQAHRYGRLGPVVFEEVSNAPGAALGRRLWAGLYFVFGEDWFQAKTLTLPVEPIADDALPCWLADLVPGLLQGSLLLMLAVGLLGWRWSQGWRKQSRLATLAVVWLPLPYILSHAGTLSGPRLPLDGIALTYVAFALACIVPGVRRSLVKGPAGQENKREKPAGR